MDNFLCELKSNIILTRSEIINIKNYIEKKYINENSKKKAEILSDAIHQVLDKNMKDFPQSVKSVLKPLILKNTLFKGEDNINLYDIFLAIVSDEYIAKENVDFLLLFINSNIIDSHSITEKDLLPFIPSLEKSLQEIQAISVENSYIPQSEKEKAIVQINTDNKIEPVHRKKMFCILTIITLLLTLIYPINKILTNSSEDVSAETADSKIILTENSLDEISPHLPKNFKYKDINKDSISKFLQNKNSLLAEEPYFSAIISSAKEFNLNPLVLFAITGQEQGFVPKDQDKAYKIANNPFNVYHSWQEYNTDITNSSRIAARTVVNICKDLPKDTNPFTWINHKYAEDKAWAKGVQYFFNKLESINSTGFNDK